jgi:hypothetical protein
LAFGLASNGYVVQTQGFVGIRQEAASAKLARQLASEYYGVDATSIKGYVYGGSGGSQQMAGIVENTVDVWQGGVILIQAIQTSIPNGVAVNAFGTLVLEGKRASIADALLWGGSGNPYQNLTELEALVFDEVSKLGTPQKQWEVLTYADKSAGLVNFWPAIQAFDPTYASDFWSLPGYAGSEQSPLGDFLRARRAVGNTTIGDIVTNGTGYITSFSLPDLPAADLRGSAFTLLSSTGTVLANLSGIVNTTSRSFAATIASNTTAITAGSVLGFDNSFYIAAHLYYRHNIPTRADHVTYYQFRAGDSPTGEPIYPQRPIEIGPRIASGPSGGGNFSGKLTMPIITVQNLLDGDAVPPNPVWYSKQVRRELGDAYGDNYRLWFNENAEHNYEPIEPRERLGRLIQYNGIFFQALRDVSSWVEKGIAPPVSTDYKLEDGQIQIPYNGTVRGGIQPSVHLCSGGPGVKRIEVSTGQEVNLVGHVDVPAGTGCVIQAGWDFVGQGNFTRNETIPSPASHFIFTTSYTYDTPGTYYPVLRVASTRDCTASDEELVVALNLDRNRIIVT